MDNKKTLLDSRKVTNSRGKFKKTTSEIEFPELNKLMGLKPIDEIAEINKNIKIKSELLEVLTIQAEQLEPGDELTAINKKIDELKLEISEMNEDTSITTVEVRMLSLTEYLAIKRESSTILINLLEGILAAAVSKEMVESEAVAIYEDMPFDAQYRLKVCGAGLIEPQLKWSDLVFIGEYFPMVIMKMSERIIELTHGGADLKKNF